jgi:hypothetical protein
MDDDDRDPVRELGLDPLAKLVGQERGRAMSSV